MNRGDIPSRLEKGRGKTMGSHKWRPNARDGAEIRRITISTVPRPELAAGDLISVNEVRNDKLDHTGWYQNNRFLINLQAT